MQIRSANPHFHNETEDDHITAMWRTGLSTIYHHLLAGSSEDDEKMMELKADMERFVADKTGCADSYLRPAMVYPPLETLDLQLLASGMSKALSLKRIGV
jgi:hypothetical protein